VDPDGSSTTLQIALFIGCIFLSCFFSAAETALTTLSRVRLRNLNEGGSKAAKRISKMLEQPEKMLTSILVMNNFVNISASALSTALAIQVFGNRFVGIATGVVTLIVLIFGEITPKTFAVRFSERIALSVAGPISLCVLLLTPVVFLLNKVTLLFLIVTGANKRGADTGITEEEIITMVNMSHEQGLLETEERHMIRNVFEFGDGLLREVMTPRVNVAMVDIEWSYQEALEVFREHQFTRMPVYRDNPDNIVGILNLKDLILGDIDDRSRSIEKVLRPVNFVYEFNNIDKIFAEMRRDRVGISVVLDEYGIMSGIVTMEDFIEEIIGEIDDEYDEAEEELIHKVGEEYLVDGTLSIDAFNETVGTDFTSQEFESIGGYLIGAATELPGEGTTLHLEGISFTIEKVDANRIETIRVKHDTIRL
jgi:CBS domain containing-hemolysin-like protein